MRRCLLLLLGLLLVASGCGGEGSVFSTTASRPLSSTTVHGSVTSVSTAGTSTTVVASTDPATTLPPVSVTDAAWLGGFDCGVTALDAAGEWRGYRESSGDLETDQIFDIVIGTDGTTWIAHSLGVYRVTSTGWESVGSEGMEALALDPVSGDLWGVAYGKAAVYDGVGWTDHDAGQFGEGEFVELVKDVAVDSQGRAWVATNSTVAMFDGSTWTSWGVGSGLPDTSYMSIESIAAGPDGRTWVSHSNGLMVFDGQSWRAVEVPEVTQPKDITVSADGRVWLATYSDGLAVMDDSGWRLLTPDNSGLLTTHVRVTAVDGRGRVWVGTTWGLAVLDGTDWATYTMANSGMGGNCVEAVAVSGAGPTLPSLQPERTGSVTGLIVTGSQPAADTKVALCSEQASMMFSGPHPCSDQPYSASTSTDASGRYTFADVPSGEYEVAWVGPDGSWYSYLIGGTRIRVGEGTTEAPTIDTTEG
jgi:hypothetical protein